MGRKIYEEFLASAVARHRLTRKKALRSSAVGPGAHSIIRNPARRVSDGIAAWLRLVGGNDFVQRHRTVVGWMREFWAAMVDVAIEEPQRNRGRSGNGLIVRSPWIAGVCKLRQTCE